MKRLLPFVILIVLILGLAVTATFLFNPEKSKAELSAYLTQRLQHKVLINQLDLKMLPPALHLGGLTVLRANETPFFQAEHVDAPLAWGALFKAQLAPRELRFTGWTLSVKREPNGTWESQTWEKSVSSLGSNTAWPLQGVQFSRGQINAMDPWGAGDGLQWRSVSGDFQPATRTVRLGGDLMGAGPALKLTFEGQGQFLGASSNWNGTFKAQNGAQNWTVQVKSTGKGLKAHGESAEWNWDSAWAFAKFTGRLNGMTAVTSSPLLLQQWKTDFSSDGGTSRFTHSGLLGGGATEAKGTLQPRASDQLATVTLAFKDIPMEAIPDTQGFAGNLQGRVTAMADFDLQISTLTRQSYQGKGTLEIRDGLYRFPAATLQRIRKAKTLAYFRKKFPGFEQTGLPFKRMAIAGDAKSGFLTLGTCRVEAGSVTAGFAGRVDLAKNGLDLYSRLQIREPSPALKKLIPGRYVYGSAGREVIQPIYGRLQGTPAEWFIKATTASKVPAALQKQLKKSIQ